MKSVFGRDGQKLYRYQYSNFSMDYGRQVDATRREDYVMFQRWTQHVANVVAVLGQHVALHDEDFVPLCEILPDRLEASQAINEVGSLELTFTIHRLGEPVHPAVKWLVADIEQDVTSRISPVTDVPRYVIVSRPGGVRLVYRVELVTLSGIDRPTTLKIVGTDLMSYFSRLPLMSLPSSWVFSIRSKQLPILFNPGRQTYTKFGAVGAYDAAKDGQEIAPDRGVIPVKQWPIAHVLGRPQFARVYDKATAYGPPAATIWQLLDESLSSVMQLFPQFLAVDMRRGTLPTKARYGLTGFTSEETARYWDSDTWIASIAGYYSNRKPLVWQNRINLLSIVDENFGTNVPRYFALKLAPAEKDALDLVAIRPTDGPILDELKTYLDGAGLRLTAELYYQHELQGVPHKFIGVKSDFQMPVVVFGLEWI